MEGNQSATKPTGGRNRRRDFATDQVNTTPISSSSRANNGGVDPAPATSNEMASSQYPLDPLINPNAAPEPYPQRQRINGRSFYTPQLFDREFDRETDREASPILPEFNDCHAGHPLATAPNQNSLYPAGYPTTPIGAAPEPYQQPTRGRVPVLQSYSTSPMPLPGSGRDLTYPELAAESIRHRPNMVQSYEGYSVRRYGGYVPLQNSGLMPSPFHQNGGHTPSNASELIPSHFRQHSQNIPLSNHGLMSAPLNPFDPPTSRLGNFYYQQELRQNAKRSGTSLSSCPPPGKRRDISSRANFAVPNLHAMKHLAMLEDSSDELADDEKEKRTKRSAATIPVSSVTHATPATSGISYGPAPFKSALTPNSGSSLPINIDAEADEEEDAIAKYGMSPVILNYENMGMLDPGMEEENLEDEIDRWMNREPARSGQNIQQEMANNATFVAPTAPVASIAPIAAQTAPLANAGLYNYGVKRQCVHVLPPMGKAKARQCTRTFFPISHGEIYCYQHRGN